jgi:hypothetical protein
VKVSSHLDTQNMQEHNRFILVQASKNYVQQHDVPNVRNAQIGSRLQQWDQESLVLDRVVLS